MSTRTLGWTLLSGIGVLLMIVGVNIAAPIIKAADAEPVLKPRAIGYRYDPVPSCIYPQMTIQDERATCAILAAQRQFENAKIATRPSKSKD